MKPIRLLHAMPGRTAGLPDRRRGFTLVELLAVVAIIILLLSILVPIAGSSAKIIDNVTCQSNLENIGKGTIMYSMDNKGKWPHAQRWAFQPGNWGWYVPQNQPTNIKNGLIWKYVGDEKVYVCPVFRQVAQPFMPQGNKIRHSYSMHEAFSHGWGGKFIAGMTDPEGNRPSERLFISEEMPGYTGYPDQRSETCAARYPINNSALGVGTSISRKIDGVATYHEPDGKNYLYWTGWGNVLFLDGHAQLRRIDEHADVLVIAWPDRRGEWEASRRTP